MHVKNSVSNKVIFFETFHLEVDIEKVAEKLPQGEAVRIRPIVDIVATATRPAYTFEVADYSRKLFC